MQVLLFRFGARPEEHPLQGLYFYDYQSVIYCYIILTAVQYMLKNLPKAPRPLLSPRRYTLRPSTKNNCNVDQEYQLDTPKNTKKR